MSFNNVIETSTSTGTGNFVLAGKKGDSNLRFSDRLMVNQYTSYMIVDELGNREKGKGYLSDTNTFVRAYVLDNSLNNMTKINFPSGTKDIYIPSEARAIGSDVINNLNWYTSPHSIGYKPNFTLTANCIHFSQFIMTHPMKVSAVGLKVQTAGGTGIRIGIYNLTRQSDAGAAYDTLFPRMIDLGVLDSTSTGNKSISTDFYLGEGAYLFAAISDGAPIVLGNASQYVWNTGIIGISNNMSDAILGFRQEANAANFTSLPATTFGALTVFTNLSTPSFFVRGNAI